MQLIYFLSYGVLIVSKTKQSPEKTGGVARLQRRSQVPIVHFSCQCVVKRGPLGPRKNFLRQFVGNTSRRKFLAKLRRTTMFSSCNVVFREAAVVQELLLDQLLDDFRRRFAEFCFQLFA